MSDGSQKGSPKDGGDAEAFDVVMMHGPTEDGGGAKVLRARPGRIEAGEVRPMREGKPLTSGEIVRLEKRADAPQLYDVKVEHEVKPAAPPVKSTPGPAQVATTAYRESWDRVFGSRGSNAAN
jgi:hypothetical protein